MLVGRGGGSAPPRGDIICSEFCRLGREGGEGPSGIFGTKRSDLMAGAALLLLFEEGGSGGGGPFLCDGGVGGFSDLCRKAVGGPILLLEGGSGGGLLTASLDGAGGHSLPPSLDGAGGHSLATSLDEAGGHSLATLSWLGSGRLVLGTGGHRSRPPGNDGGCEGPGRLPPSCDGTDGRPCIADEGLRGDDAVDGFSGACPCPGDL